MPRTARTGHSPRPIADPPRAATVPAAALLPIRFFFGVTFLYAGLDKLVDPRFFDPASPGSIQAQMLAFERGSPLGALVALARPEAGAIGLLIAIAEVAIGIGALTGLAFRVAAVGGALLSLIFFLTVSWGTRPYYLGPDLPYAVGWLALALAGHGGLLVPSWIRVGDGVRDRSAARPGRTARADSAPSPERRALLQTGLLAVAAVAVSSLALPVRILGLERLGPASTPGPSAGESPTSGIGIAATADVDAHGAVAFTVPFDAPAPLPAGDPAIIVRLADGSYVAFDAVCTHAGCTVEWDAADAALACPCHGAVFDPQHGGAAVVGPAQDPLPSIPIVVDPASGRILLRT
jgi:thiosulfate dehydrogenase [quinone] large subunit